MECSGSEQWSPDHLSTAHWVECYTQEKASQRELELLPIPTKCSRSIAPGPTSEPLFRDLLWGEAGIQQSAPNLSA